MSLREESVLFLPLKEQKYPVIKKLKKSGTFACPVLFFLILLRLGQCTDQKKLDANAHKDKALLL